MHNREARRLAARVGLVLCMISLSGAACTDSSSDSGADHFGDVTFTGEPVKVGVAAPIDTPVGTYPQIFSSVQAAARAINTNGGLNGHKLEIVTCNTQADPNQEAACGRKMASEGVIAVVGSLVVSNVSGFEAALTEHDIADLGANALQPASYQGTNTFPIDFPSAAYAACTNPDMLEAAGADSVALVAENTTPSRASADAIAEAAENQGTTVASETFPNPGVSDYSPYVENASDGDPGLAVLALGPTSQAGFVTAAAGVGKDWAYCSRDTAMAPASIKQLGAAASKYFIGATFPPPSASDRYPGIEDYVDQMKVQEESGDEYASLEMDTYNPAGMRAWLGMQALKSVVEGIQDEVTSSTFLNMLRNSQSVDVAGVIGPIDFTAPIGTGDYPRVYNDIEVGVQWNVDEGEFNLLESVKFHGVPALLGGGS